MPATRAASGKIVRSTTFIVGAAIASWSSDT
jgi:hypothetical protein